MCLYHRSRYKTTRSKKTIENQNQENIQAATVQQCMYDKNESDAHIPRSFQSIVSTIQPVELIADVHTAAYQVYICLLYTSDAADE